MSFVQAVLEHLAVVRASQPPGPPAVTATPIAAYSLVPGDRFLWADQVLTARWLRGGRGFVLRVECANGPDRFPLDLHEHEEVLVLTPRPFDRPRETA